MGWFERVISMDGRLQGKARSNRRLMFCVSVSITLATIVPTAFTNRSVHVYMSACLHVLPQLVVLMMCLCRMDITHNIVRGYIVVMSVAVMSLDLSMRTIGSPPVWSMFVLLADLSLIIGIGRRFATWLTAVAAMWVAITAAEEVMRFGLYDLPGSVSYAYRSERMEHSCSCAHPPCPVPGVTGFTEMQISLIVLLIDFVATRGFAFAAEREKDAMARTIETVEAIAQLLAGYDVDTVAGMLQDADAEERLPAAMYEALQMLEQNLRVYRPYLPKSCLPAEASGNSMEETVPERSFSGDTASSHHPTEPPVGVVKQLGALKSIRSTLLAVNTCNTLPMLDQDPYAFTSFFDMLLSTALAAVESRRGMTDMFIGDRILISFNASRRCATHCNAAAGTAQHIMHAVRAQQDNSSDSPRIDIGAASGHVLCGDTGCVEMRRFSLLGPLCLLACGMERAARAFGLDITCNVTFQRDAVLEHILLLVPRLVRLVKPNARGSGCARNAIPGDGEKEDDGTCSVYELLVRGTEDAPKQGEWMYHVGKAAAEWDPYNAAMRAYLSGASLQAAAELAGGCHKQAHSTLSLLGNTSPLDLCV